MLSMDTKTLSKQALELIEAYSNFKIESAVCSVPYFNNKTVRARAALAVFVGKGTPSEIRDELQTIFYKEKTDTKNLTSQNLKKILVDHNLGIDCSGFTFQLLNAESEARKISSLSKNLFFPKSGLIGRFIALLNPVKNTDVLTFAHEKNSHTVNLSEVEPGDIITMTDDPEGDERNHILIITKVEYQNSLPIKVTYTHAVAYPEDGLYGSGIKTGSIIIKDHSKSLTDSEWSENGFSGQQNRIFARATKSNTQLRRLNWFK